METLMMILAGVIGIFIGICIVVSYVIISVNISNGFAPFDDFWLDIKLLCRDIVDDIKSFRCK